MNLIQTWLLSFHMNVLSHSPIFLFPSEVLSYAVNYLLKASFSKLGFSHMMQLFPKVEKNS